MTPKQKQAQVEALKTLIKSFGYIEDRWGNYKTISGSSEFRIKLMSNNIRAERKAGDSWVKRFSIPIVKIDFTTLATWLANHRAN